MPIGANALYVPAELTRAAHVGIDRERFFKLKASDPVRDIYAPSGWGTRWPGDRSHAIGSMQVPDDLIIPDARGGDTPNECCAFLAPDGRTVYQLEPTCRVEKAAPIVGYPREPQDLYGDGRLGTHWGSGLSTLGGSIRVGELTGPNPIRHALKLNIWGARLYFSSTAKGWRWPADRNDSGAETIYTGKNPKLQMGSLLALQPRLRAKDLGISTDIGRKLFEAFQDYGAYVADDSGWDDYDLCAEIGVEGEVKEKTGVSLVANSGRYYDDLIKIVEALSVVDNNSPQSVGGGGRPRRNLAPEITAARR